MSNGIPIAAARSTYNGDSETGYRLAHRVAIQLPLSSSLNQPGAARPSTLHTAQVAHGMQTPQKSEPAPSPAAFTPSAAAVRDQLHRLLAHPLFTNSKRYPVLLAYVVEQSLLGNAGDLKERTLGVEAFGREPAYDVTLDPVVRMTAAEVRKRLIQYYYAPEHAGQLVIELPLGAYAPSFREPESHPSDGIASSAQNATPPSPVATTPPAAFFARHWMTCSLALLGAALLGFVAGNIRLPRPPSSMERFWQPITATTGRVTYCLGEPVDGVDSVDRARQAPAALSPAGSLNVSDVITLARSIEPIVPRNGAFRVVAASAAGFTQLREGPIVLIGAFDNPWTLRITQDLPFGFQLDHNQREIVDRRNPQGKFWTLEWQTPNQKLAADYAIVARIHDNTTGQPVIILAGILAEGTEAAGELVSSPAALDTMLAAAPANWDKLNLEAVVETRVIDGHPGPPKVIALRTW